VNNATGFHENRSKTFCVILFTDGYTAKQTTKQTEVQYTSNHVTCMHAVEL